MGGRDDLQTCVSDFLEYGRTTLGKVLSGFTPGTVYLERTGCFAIYAITIHMWKDM